MKFTIDRDLLSEVLFRIQGVCAQKSTLAILSSCLVEAHKDGTISVQGTDLDVSVNTRSPANVAKTGRVALVAKRFFETVKSLAPGEVSLSLESNQWVNLESGKLKARIAGNHGDEFPNIPVIREDLPVQMPAMLWLDMIEKTHFSISTDESRAAFTGALFSISESGVAQMVSTDGHRLSKIDVQIDPPPQVVPEVLRKGVIIPRKGLNELRRNIDGSGTIAIDVEKEDLLVQTEKTALAVRLIPGRFPNFSKVIPSDLEHRAVLSKGALTQAIKRAALYTAKLGNTRLTLKEGQLEIYAYDAEAGEVKDSIDCDYKGKGVSAGFNYRYILDVLSVIEGDEVIIELIDTESPSVVRDPVRDDVLYIVMPMQF